MTSTTSEVIYWVQMCFSTKHQMEVLCMKSLKSGIIRLVKGVSSNGGQLFISVKLWDLMDYYDVQGGVTWPTEAAQGICRLLAWLLVEKGSQSKSRQHQFPWNLKFCKRLNNKRKTITFIYSKFERHMNYSFGIEGFHFCFSVYHLKTFWIVLAKLLPTLFKMSSCRCIW